MYSPSLMAFSISSGSVRCRFSVRVTVLVLGQHREQRWGGVIPLLTLEHTAQLAVEIVAV
jgi:hypothetical protein